MKNNYEAQRKTVVRVWHRRENQLREGGPGSGRRSTGASLRVTQPSKYAVKLGPFEKLMIGQIVGRLHVGASNRNAIRAVSKKIPIFNKLTRATRHNVMKTTIKAHQDNRKLYGQVMGGRLK